MVRFSQCPFSIHFMHWWILTPEHSCIFQPRCSLYLNFYRFGKKKKKRLKCAGNENYVWDWPDSAACTGKLCLGRERGQRVWTLAEAGAEAFQRLVRINMEVDEIFRLRGEKKIEEVLEHKEVLFFTLSVKSRKCGDLSHSISVLFYLRDAWERY